MRGPLRIFGSRRPRKQDQKIAGLGHGFIPASPRRGEEKVLQFVLARPQRGMVGLDRGKLTPHSGRVLRGHPSSTVQMDYVPICPLSAGCRSTGRKPSGRSRAFISTLCRVLALACFDHQWLVLECWLAGRTGSR